MPLLEAFKRYCLVTGIGQSFSCATYFFALYIVHSIFKYDTPWYIMPIFVGLGAFLAMFITFFGFKKFAFKV